MVNWINHRNPLRLLPATLAVTAVAAVAIVSVPSNDEPA